MLKNKADKLITLISVLTIYFSFIVYITHGQLVGTPCIKENNCPFKEKCVNNTPTGHACMCRLIHKLANGSWGPGFENCTDDYSPWSTYPHENKTEVESPNFNYERIPDDKFNASVSYPDFQPYYARLHAYEGRKGAWCAPSDPPDSWLQVDLGNKSTLSMIGTQGRDRAFIPFVVETYKIQTSDAGIIFEDIMNASGNGERVFVGNTDNIDVVYNFFDPPLSTRFLRITPLTFNNLKCMRFDVFGTKILNECISGWSKCDKNADCTDTIGGYFCTCYTGYHDEDGDGFICLEINECRTIVPEYKHNCSMFADCTNTPGAFTCKCFDGYDGDGYYCEDIDECANDVNKTLCHVDAWCNNTAPDYECNCKTGYTGDGATSCIDTNECKKNLDDCHEDAMCINLPGSFSCKCYPGYQGNGRYCEDVDECTTIMPCHADATCVNKKGTYSCTCNQGYRGSGRWCEDINECETAKGCSPDEKCYNYRGGHSCVCPASMPLQYTYNKIERTILDQVLLNFRDVTIEDWRYPVDHHAHTMRTIYQLVMRTYNYHFLEVRDPFSITKVAGDAFGVELYDLRCKDIANITFPSLCNPGYKKTKFFWFTDIVEMWLVRTPEQPFENWATAPPPEAPDPNIKTTVLPLITDRPVTTKIITDANGTNITLTEQIPTTEPIHYCGETFNDTQKIKELATPNYPNKYPPRTKCVWILEAPERHNVYVSFDVDTFQMEIDKKCAYDSVEIRDGSMTGTLLGKYCGDKSFIYPKSVRSGRQKLFIIFQSDRYYQYNGFKATWGILSPRVSIGCITYNQMSTMPDYYREIWNRDNEKEDKSRFVPVSRLMACKQYPQCRNSRPGPIYYTFEHFRDDRNDKICIRWDLDTIGATYSKNGCKKVKTNKTHTVCECTTWGIVAVLGRYNVYTPRHKMALFELGKNSFFSILLVSIALTATILYLFFKDQWGAVVLEVFRSKYWDSGRMLQLHIVLSTLLAEIFFSLISFSVTATTGSCYILVFIFYYLLQTVFFWLFIYALFLQSRVQEIFDSEKYNSYRIYLIVGYGVPLLVTLTISGLEFNQSRGEKLCWLLFEGTTLWGFSGVIVTLGVVTLIILMNTMFGSRDMENGILLQEKCLRVMFTTFFVLLAAVFGGHALQSRAYYAEYLFSIFNLLQGFSIAVMYCILKREDPIIKANQIGPIPGFVSKKDQIFEDSDDNDNGEGGMDMSEVGTSSEEEEEEADEDINKVPRPATKMKESVIILEVKETDETVEASVDEPTFFHDTDSDEDQEIMFRMDEVASDNYIQ